MLVVIVGILVMVLLCRNDIYKGLYIIFVIFSKTFIGTKPIRYVVNIAWIALFGRKALKPKREDLYILLNMCLNINSFYLFLCIGLD